MGVIAMSAMMSVVLLTAPIAAADHAGFSHPPFDPERSFELVSPAYKVSGAGVGAPPEAEAQHPEQSQAAGAGTAAYVGERFAVSAHLGGIMLDSPFATANDWALAERTSDRVGWQSHSPVTRPFKCPEDYRMMQMQQASPGFETMVWAGNGGKLPFFDEMCSLSNGLGFQSLVSDWGDPPSRLPRWEPIGPLLASQAFHVGAPTYFFEVPAVSSDGSHLAVSGTVRGLAGPGDPTLDTIGHSFGNTPHSAFVIDLSAGLSDAWPGAAVRSPAAACTGGGSGQHARTVVPVRNGDGSVGGAPCAAVASGRDARLVSNYGSAIVRMGQNHLEVGTSNLRTISDDGARTFFMAPDPALGLDAYPGIEACTSDTGTATRCPSQLFVRQENADGEIVTRWLSRPQHEFGPGAAGLLGPAYFEGASGDGSRVFFRTNSPLTTDDPNGTCGAPCTTGTASSISWDLYMFELAPGPDGDPSTPDGDPTGPGSRLTRITGGPGGGSDCSTQPGGSNAAALRFSSRNGERVYFACAAPLESGSDTILGNDDDPWNRPPAGGSTIPGGSPSTVDQKNVYVFDAAEADPTARYRFVARIPSEFGDPTRCAATAALTAAAMQSPTYGFRRANCWRGTDDGAFAIFWTAGNLSAEAGVDPSLDIYGYDADDHALARVSEPQGATDEVYECARLVCYADQGIDGGVQNSVGNPLLGVVARPATNERVVYFESASRLVDDDENDVLDVYEWRDGSLSLVSTGTAGSRGAAFKGNSADGKNVYIATADRLSWQDIDAVMDVYTARPGTGVARVPEPPVCDVLGGGCQGSGAPPLGASPRGPGGGAELAPRARQRLAVRGMSRGQRKRAARSGIVKLHVSSSAAARVTARVFARSGKKGTLGSASQRLARPGAVSLGVRLNRHARSALHRSGRLGLLIHVTSPGAIPKTLSVTLRRDEK